MLTRRHWLALSAVVVLPGCGFALRGAPTFAFESLRLQGSDGTPIARELQQALIDAGVRVFSSRLPASPEGETGQVVLTVLTDQRERSVVGQTAAGQVRELQLRTRFVFRLRTPTDKIVIDDTELLLERDISFNETQVLAKDAEEQLLFRDMRSDIVQQVVRRLAAVKAL